LKDPQNYELYDYAELGRGEPVTVETGREICSGEYGGISGFRHLMKTIEQKIGGNFEEKLGDVVEISFASTEEAEKVLELVRYANVCAQKPLVEEELLFIARYPDIARKLLTLTPLS
jgi:hypothetical protein